MSSFKFSVVLPALLLVGCQKDAATSTEPKPTTPAAVAPAASPSAPAAPKFAKWKSTDLVAIMKKKAPANGYKPMTKDDYGLAPMLADEGTRFLWPALGPDKGGRIMSFSNPEDLAKTKAYYDDLKKASAAFFSWTIAKDNLLVQVNGEMPEEDFKKFGKLLAMLDQPAP